MQGVVTLTGCKDLSGKHPVSALTELCSKRRWGPPIFTQAFDCGPPHKKQFIFKVNLRILMMSQRSMEYRTTFYLGVSGFNFSS
jgi:hypothetical protein